MSKKRLVLVESPTKAKTIRKFLSEKEYEIQACMGHIRDLPSSASEIPEKYKGEEWARLGVNVKNKFEPLYVVSADKRKTVKSIKDALKEADELYIATDEDREGESIGWHLLEVLKPKIPVKRMVFHEITKEAILEALDHTRELDKDLVDAQETRRILDRLVGYTVSPLLWRKISKGLSAGRVQSVAVRLLVLRERERMAFVPASYWDLKAILDKDRKPFEAQMTHWKGQRLATSKDFDDQTGKLIKGKEVLLMSQIEAMALAEQLPKETWKVAKVEDRNEIRKPYPPFITSTLQQEASRKLRMASKQTMRTAQSLYERGLITYMRTDSTNLSNEAVEASRKTIQKRYGAEFLSPQPRAFASKSKNAQEAHEAIRPAGTEMKTAQEWHLSGEEAALYDLIWKRTVACQMADARFKFTAATIEAGLGEDTATFRASGKVIEFAGFLRAYVEGSDDPDSALEDQEAPLPALQEGDSPNCQKVVALGHETKAPARYTEASLIQMLEAEGIGRPSTYSSIMDTITARGYAHKKGMQLVPSFTAFATTQLLESNFDKLIDLGFTAEMEQVLDDISQGTKQALPYLESFYSGKKGLEKQVEEGLDKIDARIVSTVQLPKWKPFIVRVGRYGAFAEQENALEKTIIPIPDDAAPADLTVESFQEFLRGKEIGDKPIGMHPELNVPIFARKGPYGDYVQLGEDTEDKKNKPKRASLPKGLALQDITLEKAVDLLRLPRTVGTHPETGKPIIANVGRFGPYVEHNKLFASLGKTDDAMTVTLERALEVIAVKEGKKVALNNLGDHPQTGDPIEVLQGRYGPYIKYQKLNVTIPKDKAPESLTMEEALALIAEKEANPTTAKAKRGRR